MRHWSRSILGSGLFLGCVVLFNVKLIALLNVGTCASGNQPFEISRPCPVGATFLVMGVPALVFLATRAGTGSRMRTTRRFAPAGQPVSAPEPRYVPAPGARAQGAERFDDDTISKLERLQRLREAGALTAGGVRTGEGAGAGRGIT